MKLTLNFQVPTDDCHPDLLDECIFLTRDSWYLETYDGNFIPADVTHFAVVDMSNLK